MNSRTYLSILTLFSAITCLAADQDVKQQSFNAKAGGKLHMRVDRGSIKINTSNSDKVDIKVVRELKRASASKAAEVYGLHKIDMTQDGNVVKIIAENNKGKNWLKNPFNNLHVEYTISVPSTFDLDLSTAGGNVDVQDLQGQVKAKTSGGNLNFGAIKGEINADTSGGNITLQGSHGNADVRTSGGDLKIGAIDGNLVAKTSGGNITMEQVKGSIDAETSGGDIRIKEAHGPVMASTSGGNVSAQLFAQPKGDCALKTSGGNVAVTLADKLAVDVDAHTSGGSVHSDFPGNFNKQRTKLTAQINGGGPNLVLQTSGGNVDIRKK